ncbi:hypothetical protein PILCRDRAFT_736798 [Piloderma croceum F 1598]|uniref:Uncharacterized protein n=1 Tax=Piloderma croceum (strain F 1598) TaxID=765440 RepID=A0A0C3AG90_PILCF|nr:hypothetical protein PILCRDRAFT_736798 [Piloderma croceum F 1598]
MPRASRALTKAMTHGSKGHYWVIISVPMVYRQDLGIANHSACRTVTTMLILDCITGLPESPTDIHLLKSS